MALTGPARVRASLVRQKLGESAFFVLQAMWSMRDWVTGETRATNAGLARARGFAPLALRVVRKAAARLKAAGLVVPMGRREARVRRGGEDVDARVFVRRVYGGIAAGAGGAFWLVPEETARWLQTACGWGGARCRKSAELSSKQLQEGPVMRVQEGPPIYTKSKKKLEESPKGQPAPPAHDFPEEAPRADNLPVEDPALGTSLGGTFPAPQRGETTSSPLPGVPAFPGHAEVGWPVVPRPPLLDPQAGPIERAAALLKAYRGAVKSRYKTDPWHARGYAGTHKAYRQLVAASEALLERRIPPAAWAAWSCDAWKSFKGGKRPPPIPWVFSVKRIDERAGWYGSEENGYTGGNVVLGPKYKALVARYQAARAAILYRADGERPRDVFERYFPGDAYPRALAEAREECARTNETLRRQAENGVFLWD